MCYQGLRAKKRGRLRTIFACSGLGNRHDTFEVTHFLRTFLKVWFWTFCGILSYLGNLLKKKKIKIFNYPSMTCLANRFFFFCVCPNTFADSNLHQHNWNRYFCIHWNLKFKFMITNQFNILISNKMFPLLYLFSGNCWVFPKADWIWYENKSKKIPQHSSMTCCLQ